MPLAALVALACAEKPHFGQQIELSFKNPELRYTIDVGDHQKRPVNQGSRQVLVRVSGDEIKTIIVEAYDEDGKCGETKVEIKEGKGPYLVIVTCTRLAPDAGAPPDADLPPDAGPAPDAGPDLSPDTGPSPACQYYCATMRDRCPLVYPPGDDCLATCAAYGWLPGQREMADTTVECRTGEALLATTPSNTLMQCYHAGPTGGGFCGSLCLNFCTAAARICPNLFPDGGFNRCFATCLEPNGHLAFRSDSGNTLDCRIFWMGEAAKSTDPEKICAGLEDKAQTPLCHD
jgi:hypothetical protein